MIFLLLADLHSGQSASPRLSGTGWLLHDTLLWCDICHSLTTATDHHREPLSEWTLSLCGRKWNSCMYSLRRSEFKCTPGTLSLYLPWSSGIGQDSTNFFQSGAGDWKNDGHGPCNHSVQYLQDETKAQDSRERWRTKSNIPCQSWVSGKQGTKNKNNQHIYLLESLHKKTKITNIQYLCTKKLSNKTEKMVTSDPQRTYLNLTNLTN